jgi:hypothetical protein
MLHRVSDLDGFWSVLMILIILDENLYTVKESIDTVLDTGEEVDLEVKAERTM